VPDNAPEFVKSVTAELMALRGDAVPVSKMPVDGKYPTGTTKYEKRNVAVNIPQWVPELCLQCGMCSLVCPHAAIRVKDYDAKYANGNAPKEFKSIDAKGKEFAGMKFTVQVAPEDCTGCGACVHACPGQERDANKKPTGHKAINMELQEPIRDRERANYDYFLSIPNTDRSLVRANTVKGSQCLCRLWRDGLREATQPTLRRPGDDRQRHRLLVDLRRQPADDALYDACRRPRADLEQ
jgi:pyruvate-ferredoxin/flavodoxin oxidoreductase